MTTCGHLLCCKLWMIVGKWSSLELMCSGRWSVLPILCVIVEGVCGGGGDCVLYLEMWAYNIINFNIFMLPFASLDFFKPIPCRFSMPYTESFL